MTGTHLGEAAFGGTARFNFLEAVHKNPIAYSRRQNEAFELFGRDLTVHSKLFHEFFNWKQGVSSPYSDHRISECSPEGLYEKIELFGPFQICDPQNLNSVWGLPRPLIDQGIHKPSVSLIDSAAGDYCLNYAFYLPMLLNSGTRNIIPELSARNYQGLHTRGGRNVLSSEGPSFNHLLLIHDIFYGPNYCHWLLDWLPRLLLMQHAGINIKSGNIVFSRKLVEFERETLMMLGIDPNQIVEFLDEGKNTVFGVRCKSFSGISTSGRHFTHALCGGRPEVGRLVRQALLKFARPSTKQKLILNRKSNRRIILDSGGESILRKAGFTEVFTEGMSVQDQINLFSNASAIIGVHGAGLANFIFAPHGTPVLEVFNENLGTAAFSSVSRAVGLNYHAVSGDLQGRDPKGWASDVFLSTEIIETWMQYIGSQLT